MPCSQCGQQCHGQYCEICERLHHRGVYAEDTSQESEQKKAWQCCNCGCEFFSVEWSQCPECESRRRRAAAQEADR